MSKEGVKVLIDGPVALTMLQEGKPKERLAVRNEYPVTGFSTEIFRSFGLMYLVSTYLPEKITTDFSVPEKFRELISLMYKSELKEPPKFTLTDKKLVSGKGVPKIYEVTDKDRAVLTYSGGKDSMWNLNWLLKEKGVDNVLAVHFKGMNRSVAKGEYDATLKQAERVGFQLKVLDLLNSSKGGGRNVMRSRDMFIVGLTIPLALRFGAVNIYLEGGRLPKGTAPGSPFNMYEESWKAFNNLLTDLGIPIQASWKEANGGQAINELMRERSDWLRLVHNCFSPPCYKPGKRRGWQKAAPTFPLYETQCGSCAKCREVNIARIEQDPALKLADPSDIKEYVRSTILWSRNHKQAITDLLGTDFKTRLFSLSQKYGLESLYQKYLTA